MIAISKKNHLPIQTKHKLFCMRIMTFLLSFLCFRKPHHQRNISSGKNKNPFAPILK